MSFERTERGPHPRLSSCQKELVDIVFGRVSPDKLQLEENERIAVESTDSSTLDLMYRMLMIEFNASLQKEINSSEEATRGAVILPQPFDVFLVEPSFTNKNISIAVNVPIKFGREILWVWYDEYDELWVHEDLVPIRKVSSLSGASRVMENLKIGGTKLMMQAMERTNLFNLSALPLKFHTINGLNKSQSSAVSTMKSKSFERGFFVIQGPPGTGKTTTLVDMISQTSGKVIVSAPSNAAVANLALKLFKKSRFDINQLCVFGQNCDKTVHFLNPTIRQEKFMKFQHKFEDLSTEEDMKKTPTDEEMEKTPTEMKMEKELHEFCDWLNLPNELPVEDLYKICMGEEEEEDAILKADVVFCTLNSSGSQWLRRHAGDRSTFFLDEAGQCNEAEFYLATTFPGVEKIVVVGDPMQLPPTVIDEQCKRAGFGRSWMANIQSLYQSHVHLLDTQYRMDPIILNFPNRKFYGNRIKSGDCVTSRLPSIQRPVGFIDTSRRSSEERDNFSWKNLQEAIIIRALLRQDEDILTLLKQDEFQSKVVVITPYTAQKKVLEKELKKVGNLKNWSVSTVDSFQGQEADVVILSTVRTEQIGFVDDRQRLNVALTRAKRVLRIVGSKQLFDKQKSSSTLRQLATYTCTKNFGISVDVRNLVFSFPDWREPSTWSPTLTQRFHNCLQKMTQKEKAVTLNILQAVVKPNLHVLYKRPNNNFWHISSLRGQPSISIVWVAKCDLTIEAHFVGSKQSCLTFVQRYYSNLPMGACNVESDLSGIKSSQTEIKDAALSVTASWKLSNFIQGAIEDDKITELPDGYFHLDPEQQLIVSSCPPLLLESRSGTGKTNVLFQHAINLSRDLGDTVNVAPLGFITVSKLLRSQLQKMYEEIKGIDDTALQSCVFMSLSDLLEGLAHHVLHIKYNLSDAVNFNEYFSQRKSNSACSIDTVLVENEIGGVIMGSLKSAELRRPLTLNEYKNDRRSNITNKDDMGIAKRQEVYSQFELYQKWKHTHNFFDVNDIVLEILQGLGDNYEDIFSGVYLDEIQDFSYAMIYLICSIGGSADLNWVFAGDTAQMISPGCSFKFAGLKQTLLSVRPGIESKLKKVSHLLVNYRTTKDILDLGNATLSLAKMHFPGAIEFAGREEAINDFGLKVVLCDWEEAMLTKPSFGKDQAVVFSTSNEETVWKINNWLGDHPFILKVLDSKGLEFDDVVVAFDLGRPNWKVTSQESIVLTMLRELYVAVTRAKRRLVILVKKGSDTMLDFFFSQLNYDIEFHPNTAELFTEFNTSTTTDQWLERANGLFQEERFDVASRCFDKADNIAMASLARGKHFAKRKEREQARQQFIQASQLFYDQSEYGQVLDMVTDVLNVASWEENPPQLINEIFFHECINECPDHLGSNTKKKIEIFQDKWENMSVQDIERNVTSVNKRRHFPGLAQFMQSLDDLDIQKAAAFIPCIVGDLYFEKKQYLDATRIYILGKDIHMAEDSSRAMIKHYKKNGPAADLLKLLDIWNLRHVSKNQRALTLLISCLGDPERAAEKHPSQCLEELGKRIIKFAVVEHKDLHPTLLHMFCKETFHNEVLEALKLQNENDLYNVVTWFSEHEDEKHAKKIIEEQTLAKWKTEELKQFFKDKLVSGLDVCEELSKRGHFVDATDVFLECGEISKAVISADKSLFSEDAEKYAFKIIQRFEYKTIPQNVTHRERFGLARKLFLQAAAMDKKECNEVVKIFGPKVTREFILERVPHYIPIEDKQKEYRDVYDILRKFGQTVRMSRYQILKFFHQHNKNPTLFLHFHRNHWAIEVQNREFFHLAVKHFLRVGAWKEAVEITNLYLGKNVIPCGKAVETWNLCKPYLVKLRGQSEDSSSAGFLFPLLSLFKDPISFSQDRLQVQKYAKVFDSFVILKALQSFHLQYNGRTEDPVNTVQRFEKHVKFNNMHALKVLHGMVGKDKDRNRNKGRQSNVVKYARVHILRSSLDWGQLSKDDLNVLLDIKIYPAGLEVELEKRKMYTEVTDVYLQKKSYGKAIAASSNSALATTELSDLNAEHIFEAWSSWEGTNIPRNSKLWLLLKLFKDPESSASEFGHHIVGCFGSRVVKVAVERKFLEDDAAAEKNLEGFGLAQNSKNDGNNQDD